jgi:hypothetical protein
MAKKRTPPRAPPPAPPPPAPPPAPPPPAPAPSPPRASEGRAGITAERFARLHRLVSFLADGPKTREQLLRHLQLDVRGFYRDLEVLRAAGIGVTLAERQYALDGDADAVLALLPFPDPQLTLGQARQLARGRTRAHRHLQEQIDRLVP